jgi:hypothetical protein
LSTAVVVRERFVFDSVLALFARFDAGLWPAS